MTTFLTPYLLAIENGGEKLKIIMLEGAVISLDFKILLPFDEIFKNLAAI